MLSSLANYLLGGSPSTYDVSGNDQNGVPLPVETRLNQVEVEGDEWILIDRAVETTTALEESWYVTPPACFTRAGPIHVETSPLEDLLIEHPSMSVYRAAAPPGSPDTPPPTPDTQTEFEPSPVLTGNGNADASGSPRHDRARERLVPDNPHQRRTNGNEHSPVKEEAHCLLLRTAQKVLEKRAAQALKRSRLERNNKVKEVASCKGKRPRRQDRLRLQNSGANNNRKC